MTAPDVPRVRRRIRVGIREVAAAAGVSITTVSDALNGKGRLPDTTRLHVREVADRLGYRPSAAARTLRTGRSGLLGLTTAMRSTEPFALTEFAWFAELVRSATATALDLGYALVVLPASSPHDVWGNVALDGTIVVDPVDDDPLVLELLRRGVPVVSGGHPGSTPVYGWVDNDHVAAVRCVLDHLAQAGAGRIGLLAAADGPGTGKGVAGYRAWCADRGVPPITEEYEARTPGAGRAAATRLLDRAPDAVFGLHEGCAAELLAAARARELRVPDDLLLACCGEGADPSVTSLSLQPALAGAWAVELLVGVIEDAGAGSLLPAQRTVPTRLSVRDSSTRR